ncbi:hypothetical protein GF373_04750 [bacterium]|nr:hypothetical protein [bacterium]
MRKSWKKEGIFWCGIVILLGFTLMGMAAMCFLVLEWMYTPVRQEKELNPLEEMDLSAELLPYTMYGPRKNTVIQNVLMPARKGDTTKPTISINSFGFRYGPMAKKKPTGVKRIFMIGGSVVFFGHTNKTSISGYLEDAFHARFRGQKYEVINAGVTGFNSDQELVLLLVKLIDFDPDLIIVFDGFNDFLIPSSIEQRLGYPSKFKAIEAAWYRNRQILRAMMDLPFTVHLTAGSHFMRRMNPRWSYIQHLAGYQEHEYTWHPAPTADAVVDHYAGNWQKMADILRMRGIKGLFILQPFNRDGHTYAKQYELMEAKIAQFSKQYPPNETFLQFRSYRNVMDDKKDLFYDIVHTYDAGNRYYAELMMADLQELL